VAALSQAWVFGRSLTRIVGSNPTGGMDICLLLVLCVVRLRSLRRADPSSRGVLPSMICLKCDRESSTKRGGPGPYRAVEQKEKKIMVMNFVSGIKTILSWMRSECYECWTAGVYCAVS
jgi:hypothetical protein